MNNILIVENEAASYKKLADVLRANGYKVHLTPEVDTRIVDEVNQHKPDLIILSLTPANSDIAITLQENFNVPIMHLGHSFEVDQLSGLIAKIFAYLPAMSVLGRIFF